ncbi:MAG: hypothetical protein OXG26_15215 [Caldilineaceae bacterium]|nr:hypothetical protein [Caldilineaceae bacterium]
MNPELKKVHERIDKLHDHFMVSVRVILTMNERIDDLYDHIRSQEKILDSLIELSNLDDEMTTELGEQILALQQKSLELQHKTLALDEDQVEMADDFTERLDAYKNEISRLASLVSFESYPLNSSHNGSKPNE